MNNVNPDSRTAILVAVIGATALIIAAIVAQCSSPPPVVVNVAPPQEPTQAPSPTNVIAATPRPEPTLVVEPTQPTIPTDTIVPTSVPKSTSISTPSLVPTPRVVRSTFDGMTTDGWTMHSGSFSNPGSGGGCGADNGCLVFVDSSITTTSWWIAPKKYHGDWRNYTKLKIDLWSTGGSSYTDQYGDIYIVSGNAIAQRRLPTRPPKRWFTYEIPLVDDGEWMLEGAQDLADVLANVTDFQIRAEYGDGLGDKSGIDNVELLP